MLLTDGRRKATSYQKIVLLGLLSLFSLVSVTKSASTSRSQAQSSQSHQTSLTKDTGLGKFGNPSEFAWQTWLLFDNNQGKDNPETGLESANTPRRITAKSIFIAPPLPACAEGYEADYMNRCVKIINLNEEAHRDFLLQRLNAMYAHLGNAKPSSEASSSSSSPSSSQPTGPFQLNIPLILDTNPEESNKTVGMGPVERPKESSPSSSSLGDSIPDEIKKSQNQDGIITFFREKQSNKTVDMGPTERPKESSPSSYSFRHSIPDEIKKSQNQDGIITVYEVKDVQKDKEDDEKTFFREKENTKKDNEDDQSSLADTEPIPLVEFVDESNSNTSDTVDYKIPVISITQICNRSDTVCDELNDGKNDEALENQKKPLNNSSIPPTLLLLLSPTKLPTPKLTEDLITVNNMSIGKVIVRLENTKNKSRAEEIISVSLPEHIMTSSIPLKVFVNSSGSSNISADVEETFTVSEKQNDAVEDAQETTKHPEGNPEDHDDIEEHTEEDFEDATESEDEILKHSEAGITVTVPPRRFQTTLKYSDENGDAGGSMIFSEVNINDDFIRETTLLGLNINETINVSKDSKNDDKETPMKNLEDQKIAVVMLESKIESEMTFAPEKIISSGSLIIEEQEANTEEIETTEDVKTAIPKEALDQQTSFTSTIKVDKIYSTTSKNVNPVVTIEESSIGGVIDRKLSSSSEIPRIVFPNHNDDSQVSTSDPDNSEIMIASSTNTAETILPQREPGQVPSSSFTSGNKMYNRKRIGPQSPERLEKLATNYAGSTSANNPEDIYDYDPVPRDYLNPHPYRIDDNRPVIKTIDDQRLEHNKNPDHRENFFPENFGSSYDSIRDYVRFPNFNRPHTRPGHVRFPSEEANSIHTPDDFKERYHHQPYLQQSHRGQSKTGPGATKQSYWLVSPGWRMDRQQPVQQRSRSGTSDQKRKDRSPMLLRFWTQMPLVKDPSLLNYPTYPTVPVNPDEEHEGRSSALRRVHLYKEMSPHDDTRAFAQSSPIGG